MGLISFDTFTDTNGVLIQNHTPNVGGAWAKVTLTAGGGGAVPQIQSNRLVISGIDDAARANTGCVVESGTPNINMEFDYVSALANRGVAILRYVSTGNYYSLRMRHTEADFRLAKNNGGVATVLATPSFTWVDAQMYRIRVVMEGDNFYCYIDGSLKITAFDSFQNTATMHGLGRGSSNGNDSFDNFSLHSLQPKFNGAWAAG